MFFPHVSANLPKAPMRRIGRRQTPSKAVKEANPDWESLPKSELVVFVFEKLVNDIIQKFKDNQLMISNANDTAYNYRGFHIGNERQLRLLTVVQNKGGAFMVCGKDGDFVAHDQATSNRYVWLKEQIFTALEELLEF